MPTDIVKEKKTRHGRGEKEGKERDCAYMSQIPIKTPEKFWGGSREPPTLKR